MALNALVVPNFSPPLETDSAECAAVLAASSMPALIFFPMSVRPTSSKLFYTIQRSIKLQVDKLN